MLPAYLTATYRIQIRGIVSVVPYSSKSMTMLALLGLLSQISVAQDYKSKIDLELGGSIGRILLADLNADGLPEIIAALPEQNSIAIAYSPDQQGYQKTNIFSSGQGRPTDLALADFDDDGILDLAVANHETNHISIFMGTGSGNFKNAQLLITPSQPHVHTLAAGDFDGDGKIDLAVDSWQNNQVLFFSGRGDGSFNATPQKITVAPQPRINITAYDFNGDGLADIATPANASSKVSVLINSGAAGYLLSTPTVAASPFHISAGDINGDGKADLAITHRAGNYRDQQYDKLTILYGDGRGAFTEAPFSPVEVKGSPTQAAIGQVGCGKSQSIAVVKQSSNEIAIITITPNGPQQKHISDGKSPRELAIADMDGNGCGDLVVSWYESQKVTIYYY